MYFLSGEDSDRSVRPLRGKYSEKQISFGIRKFSKELLGHVKTENFIILPLSVE
jgi:hypothetical protein